jgi:hypothetical protein
MAPVACPKCSVAVYETASGGWRFDPPTGCIDLEGTEWGAKGELTVTSEPGKGSVFTVRLPGGAEAEIC